MRTRQTHFRSSALFTANVSCGGTHPLPSIADRAEHVAVHQKYGTVLFFVCIPRQRLRSVGLSASALFDPGGVADIYSFYFNWLAWWQATELGGSYLGQQRIKQNLTPFGGRANIGCRFN
jgi:hypothetical protein